MTGRLPVLIGFVALAGCTPDPDRALQDRVAKLENEVLELRGELEETELEVLLEVASFRQELRLAECQLLRVMGSDRSVRSMFQHESWGPMRADCEEVGIDITP